LLLEFGLFLFDRLQAIDQTRRQGRVSFRRILIALGREMLSFWHRGYRLPLQGCPAQLIALFYAEPLVPFREQSHYCDEESRKKPMSNPTYIELEVSQNVGRDGSRGDDVWNLVVSDNEDTQRLFLEEANAKALLAMSNEEIVNLADTFAQDTLNFGRENNDGVTILGDFVEWAAMNNDAPKI
jgi:hypothetical protein